MSKICYILLVQYFASAEFAKIGSASQNRFLIFAEII